MSEIDPLTNLPQQLARYLQFRLEEEGRSREAFMTRGGYYVDELRIDKDRHKREMWCLLTRRDLLPMALPKTEPNTSAEHLRKKS
jgi:hypothetical protein